MEHTLYGAQRAKEEATKRAAAEERAAKREAEKAKLARAREWSDEEVRMLEKSLDKFPQVRALPPRAPRFEQLLHRVPVLPEQAGERQPLCACWLCLQRIGRACRMT